MVEERATLDEENQRQCCSWDSRVKKVISFQSYIWWAISKSDNWKALKRAKISLQGESGGIWVAGEKKSRGDIICEWDS